MSDDLIFQAFGQTAGSPRSIIQNAFDHHAAQRWSSQHGSHAFWLHKTMTNQLRPRDEQGNPIVTDEEKDLILDAQMALLRQGSEAVAIHLGQTILGQRKTEVHEVKDGRPLALQQHTVDEILDMLEDRRKNRDAIPGEFVVVPPVVIPPVQTTPALPAPATQNTKKMPRKRKDAPVTKQ